MSRLDRSLIGFGDFFAGEGAIGVIAAPKPKPGAKPKPGTGKHFKPYPKPARTQTVQKHGKVLKGAHTVATKAAKTIGRAMQLLSRKPAAVIAKPVPGTASARPGVRTPPARALAGRPVSVGAVAAKIISPKAKLAVTKHNAAVAKSAQASKVLAQHALKTRATVKDLAKKMVAQKKMSKLLRTPLKKRPKAHVGALLSDPIIGAAAADLLEDYYTAVGAAPDPMNPGWLDDGSPDPAFGAVPTTPGAPPIDPSLTGDPAMDALLTGDPLADPIDSGIELPAPPPMSQFITDMNVVGGIAYDGSKGKPNGFCGSYGLFTRETSEDAPGGPVAGSDPGINDYGYVWGSFDQDSVPGGTPWGGRLAENAWNKLFGRYVRYGSGSFNEVVSDAEAFSSPSKNAPNGKSYGPLVGNPGIADFKAMRVDAQGNMFWLPQEAPDWLTFPMKQAAALTAQAAAKAAKDAAAADAAAVAKAAADAAAAQAAQDAANALAESAASSEARIAQGAEVTAQAQQETAAQQALVAQQAAETQEYTSDAEQQKQAGALMIQQAQQQMEQDKQVQDLLVQQAKDEQAYYEAHPELDPREAMAASDDEGGDDEGGDLPEDVEPGASPPSADDFDSGDFSEG